MAWSLSSERNQRHASTFSSFLPHPLRMVHRKRPPLEECGGRYVLVHQSDPVDFLRTAARLVRPGGIIAFHEVDFAGGFNSLPRVWRWDAAGNLILAAFREVLPHFDSANRLIEHFSDAGLPVPNLFREILVGGGERSPLYAWIVETMRSVWPQLVEMGIVTGRGDSGRDT